MLGWLHLTRLRPKPNISFGKTWKFTKLRFKTHHDFFQFTVYFNLNLVGKKKCYHVGNSNLFDFWTGRKAFFFVHLKRQLSFCYLKTLTLTKLNPFDKVEQTLAVRVHPCLLILTHVSTNTKSRSFRRTETLPCRFWLSITIGVKNVLWVKKPNRIWRHVGKSNFYPGKPSNFQIFFLLTTFFNKKIKPYPRSKWNLCLLFFVLLWNSLPPVLNS